MFSINIQLFASFVILVVLPFSIVHSQPTQAELCLFAFSNTGFSILDVENYPKFFKDDSIMTLAQAGNYKGAASIAEYVGFVLSTSPYIATGPINQASNFSFTKFDESSKICEFLRTSKNQLTMDAVFTRNAMEFNSTVMFKIFFNIEKQYITRVNVYYPPGFLLLFFDVLFNSDNTRNFVCSTMSDPCNLPPSTKGRCMKALKSLPTLVSAYADGNSQGCRALHAVFAASNPENHCPHLSFTPMLDLNNEIKCQESSNISPDDLFDDADFEVFNAFAIEQGIDPVVGHDAKYQSKKVGKKGKSKSKKMGKEGKKGESKLEKVGKKS